MDPARPERNTSRLAPLRLLATTQLGVFLLGSLLSNLGTWMQMVAEPWLVLSLTGSSVLLGIDAFAMDAPVLLLTLLGGVLADRRDRKRTIVFFQTIQALCPTALVVLLLAGKADVWMIIALSFVVGVTDALSMPAFNSVAPSIVEREDIGTAIALNSTQFNLSRILGPALAGLVIASFGPIVCFATNALSYVPFLLTVAWVVPGNRSNGENGRARAADGARWFGELRQIASEPEHRSALLRVLGTSLLCGPLVTFTPVFVKDVLRSDVGHFGGALSAFGGGGVAGAIVVLLAENRIDRHRLASAAAIGFGALLVVVSLDRSFEGLTALLALGGAAMAISNITSNSILQTAVGEGLRGQTASLFMLAMRGGLSVGNVVAGFTVSWLGVSHALLLNGALAIFAQSWIYGLRARSYEAVELGRPGSPEGADISTPD